MHQQSTAAPGTGAAFSAWLDLLRWLAAFQVLIFHARHRVFDQIKISFSDLNSALYSGVALVSSLGQPAVIVFFVISGFLVGGNALHRFERGDFSPADYLLARLTRLWIVLIPVFVLSLVLNWLVRRYADPATDLYRLMVETAQTSEDPLSFACNAAFLQTVLCFQYAGNSPLWSLFQEFWYYIAWLPLMFGLFSKAGAVHRTLAVAASIVLLGLLGIGEFVGPNILVYFTIWLLGVVVAKKRKPFIGRSVWTGFLILLAALLLWRLTSASQVQGTSPFAEYPYDFLVGLAVANLILILKSREDLSPPPFARAHEPLASFSFTLYCLHVPLLHALCAVHWPWTGPIWHVRAAGYPPLVIYVVIVTLCFLGAYLLAQVTERHTYRLRAVLKRRLVALPMAGGSTGPTGTT